MAVMTAGRFRHIPVCEEGALVGIISIGDVVRVRVVPPSSEGTASRSGTSGVGRSARLSPRPSQATRSLARTRSRSCSAVRHRVVSTPLPLGQAQQLLGAETPHATRFQAARFRLMTVGGRSEKQSLEVSGPAGGPVRVDVDPAEAIRALAPLTGADG